MTDTAQSTSTATERFQAARDFLLAHREDYETAFRQFRWPRMDEFNWALEWFDVIARRRRDEVALWIVEEDGSEQKLSFGEMAARSAQLANWLREHGVRRGDRMIVMLGNQVELWETSLAAMKLGAVIIPATPLLGTSDLVDRVERGRARHVIAASESAAKFDDVPGDYTRIVAGEHVDGWLPFEDSRAAPSAFEPDGATHASDTLLLYFTSGTTAKPKLVEHSHASYPVGHLSTMYWLGLRPGDVHLNISSPGWAKHAWSNVYAPWNAEATVLVYNFTRFKAAPLLDQMARCGVTTFCAPPTVWRMLVQEDLGRWQIPLREIVSAGEPLNPEIIEHVRRTRWGLTIRDGFGQTETTAQVGNTPGQHVKPGSMGRPLPGYEVRLLDRDTGKPGDSGEIALDLADRPLGLMTGYRDSPAQTVAAMRDRHYHTGDLASRDADGYITYVGRADDVFKASDYLISPFELESVLLEHHAVAEAAVVPSPDPLRLTVPKAYIALAPGHTADPDTALEIFQWSQTHLAPFKRVRRLEFADLPKTISGKIRRTDLRDREQRRHAQPAAAAPTTIEYSEADFPALKH